MSGNTSPHRIFIRSIRKDPPDFAKLGRALLRLAAAKAEAEALAKGSTPEATPHAEIEANEPGEEAEA
jgi:hypothetical protein